MKRRTVSVFLLTAVMVIALVDCAPKCEYVSADDLFNCRMLGNCHSVGDKSCEPSGVARYRRLIDSARAAAPKNDHSVMVSDSDGTPYAIGIGTPNKLDTKQTYPLIVYLHGGIGTDINNKGERAYEMLGGLRDCVDVFLASPSGNRFAKWWSPRGQGRILHAARYMSLMYPIDTSKIFLAGVSDGATGCYAAASINYEPFAGFFAISGFGGMLPDLGVRLYSDNMRKRPIYNIQGGKDRLYPISAVNAFIDDLQKNGVPVIYKVYPEEEHGFDYKEREFSTIAGFVREWTKPNLKSGV